MLSVNDFMIGLGDGRTAYLRQNDNGMYEVEIHDKDNKVESACVCKTGYEARSFVSDHRNS